MAETVRAVIEAGAVGINVEDAIGGALLPPERQAERIRAARAALEATRRAAPELLERGTYGGMEPAVPFGEANGMFARSGTAADRPV